MPTYPCVLRSLQGIKTGHRERRLLPYPYRSHSVKRDEKRPISLWRPTDPCTDVEPCYLFCYHMASAYQRTTNTLLRLPLEVSRLRRCSSIGKQMFSGFEGTPVNPSFWHPAFNDPQFQLATVDESLGKTFKTLSQPHCAAVFCLTTSMA